MNVYRLIVQNLVTMLLVIGLLSGCTRGPMEPTRANVEKFTAIMQAASANMTAREIQAGQSSDEGKRRITKKLLVDPFEEAGFDLNATLRDFAVRLRDGNLTQDQAQAIMVVLSIYKDSVADFARWGFINTETSELVKAAANG